MSFPNGLRENNCLSIDSTQWNRQHKIHEDGLPQEIIINRAENLNLLVRENAISNKIFFKFKGS